MQQNQDPEVFAQPKVLPSAVPVRMPCPSVTPRGCVGGCVGGYIYVGGPALTLGVFLYVLSQGLWLSLATLLSPPPVHWDYRWAITPIWIFLHVPRDSNSGPRKLS